MIGLIGIDSSTGQDRLTFGLPQLLDGVDVVVVAVGIFGVGEALWIALWLRKKSTEVVPVGQPWMSREDFSRSWKPWLRGAAIGFPFGAMPAGGAEIPTYLSYVTEKKLAKNPEEFGHGAIEGVAGPEAANNASAAGVLVPLLTLGLPTSATAAVLLAAFQQFGLQPGPLLLDSHPDLVWALIASLFIGNTLLLLLNLPLAPLWAKLLRIPRPYLYAGILFFASIGAYASEGTTTGLYMLLVAGLLGLLLRRFGLPVVPLIIGVILGPRAELQLRRTLQLSDGDLSALVASPTAITLYCVIALMLLLPLAFKLLARNPANTDGNAGPARTPGPDGPDASGPDGQDADLVESSAARDSERDEVRR
jgi:putative tricarboxylic transport membrane protein